MLFDPPAKRKLDLVSRLPDALRKGQRSAWANAWLHGAELDAFLEGPVLTPEGDLLRVDIPFGRVLKLSSEGEWSVIAEYDGWPNGMKRLANGALLIADHKRGLVRVSAGIGDIEVLIETYEGRPLHGPNDLTLAADGTIFFTDQGASGLNAPYGRVFRYRDGELHVVLDHVPSPNGLLLSGDERTLYLAVARANAVWRVPLSEDGVAEKAGLFLQLSGGIGPDGLARCPATGALLVAHPGLGIWSFDHSGRPLAHFSRSGADYTTNLVAPASGSDCLLVTESLQAEVLSLRIEEIETWAEA